MSDCCDPTDTFWSDELAAAKQEVADLRAQIRKITALGQQSYRLNTGQTDQSVANLNLATLRKNLDSAINEVATLEARLCGAGVVRAVPGW